MTLIIQGRTPGKTLKTHFHLVLIQLQKPEKKSASSQHLCVFNHCQATDIHRFSVWCGSSLPLWPHHQRVNSSSYYLPSHQILNKDQPQVHKIFFFKHFSRCITAEGSSNHLTIFTQSRQVRRPVQCDIASSEISPQGWKRAFFVRRWLAAFSRIDHFKGTMVRF